MAKEREQDYYIGERPNCVAGIAGDIANYVTSIAGDVANCVAGIAGDVADCVAGIAGDVATCSCAMLCALVLWFLTVLLCVGLMSVGL